MSVTARVPVVAGLAFIESVRRLPLTFQATLSVEPDNRYFRYAIAVLADGGKVGYLAPEIAGQYYDTVRSAAGPITCPARRAAASDHETSGVELILDLSGVAIANPD